MKLVATVEISKERGTSWLRFNKGEGDNRRLIYDLGPSVVHGAELRLVGSNAKFRIWWKSTDSQPYLSMPTSNGDWDYDAAFSEVKRTTRLPLKNPKGRPDKVIFEVSYSLSLAKDV